MGIIRRGILGGFSGKVANVVGSSWKGIAVMRALPLSVTNPKTVGQVEQRSAFSIISKLASSILTVWVKPLWDRSAQSMSGYNAFIQQNVDIVKADKGLIIKNLTMSKGKLGQTATTGIGSAVADQVSLEWDGTPTGSFQMSTDKFYALVFNDESKLIGSSSGVVDRSREQLSIDLSDVNVGDKLIAVSCFAREDGTIVGDAFMLDITVS